MEKTMKKSTPVGQGTLLVSEIFHSLQGEGPWIGLPASFVRLSGCVEPLCPWCDTPYALEGGEEMAVGDIVDQLMEHRAPRVVVTGGEPFLQWESGLGELHRALREKGLAIQYETSGKVGIPPLSDALVVCSPKFVGGQWRFDPRGRERIDFFKFLAGAGDWRKGVERFVEGHGIDRDRVYLMPLGATREEQLRGMGGVFSYCVEHGYRMSARLHVLARDNERGV